MSSNYAYHAAATPLVSNTNRSNKAACVPCSSMDPSNLMPVDQVKQRVHETLPLWTVGSKDGVSCYLHRTFTAKNFQAALDALKGMGAIAEMESHHPNFHLTNYRELEIEIWTHKLRGVTENDLTLARKLDEEVQIDYSPKWLESHPEAKHTAKPEPNQFDI